MHFVSYPFSWSWSGNFRKSSDTSGIAPYRWFQKCRRSSNLKIEEISIYPDYIEFDFTLCRNLSCTLCKAIGVGYQHPFVNVDLKITRDFSSILLKLTFIYLPPFIVISKSTLFGLFLRNEAWGRSLSDSYATSCRAASWRLLVSFWRRLLVFRIRNDEVESGRRWEALKLQ